MESLTSEVERDMINGVDREGNLRFAAFTGVSRRLGYSDCCGQSSTLDKKRLRDLQVMSALRREKYMKLSLGSGQKLGRGETNENINPSSSSKSLSSSSTTISTISTNQSKRIVWSCSCCTFLNSSTLLECQICQNPKKKTKSLSSSSISPLTSLTLTPITSTSSSNINQSEVINLDDDQKISPDVNNIIYNQNNNNNENINRSVRNSRRNIPISSSPHSSSSSSNPINLEEENEQEDNEESGEEICLWICSMCTYENKVSSNFCEMCESCK